MNFMDATFETRTIAALALIFYLLVIVLLVMIDSARADATQKAVITPPRDDMVHVAPKVSVLKRTSSGGCVKANATPFDSGIMAGEIIKACDCCKC